jgi:cytochrome c553
MFRVIFVTILLLSSFTLAAAGDPGRGKGMTQLCAACHGPSGNSLAGAFPNIAGQHPKYLLKQLRDIKSGERSAPLMAGQLNSISDSNLEDIAAYYAAQEREVGTTKPELVELGETVYRSGVKRKQIAACTACHLPSGEGNNLSGFPALAGQWPEYTEQQLRAFRQGDRHNDGDSKMMRNTAMDLSNDEIKAVASYIYGLR